jgi:hypothetical protein
MGHLKHGSRYCAVKTRKPEHRDGITKNNPWARHRFFRFKIHTLGYGFPFRNHKHLAKVSGLLVPVFFLRFLKSIGWSGFS